MLGFFFQNSVRFTTTETNFTYFWHHQGHKDNEKYYWQITLQFSNQYQILKYNPIWLFLPRNRKIKKVIVIFYLTILALHLPVLSLFYLIDWLIWSVDCARNNFHGPTLKFVLLRNIHSKLQKLNGLQLLFHVIFYNNLVDRKRKILFCDRK